MLEGFNMEDLDFLTKNIQKIYHEEYMTVKPKILELANNFEFNQLKDYLEIKFNKNDNVYTNQYSKLTVYHAKNDDWEMYQIFDDHVLICEKIKSMRLS